MCLFRSCAGQLDRSVERCTRKMKNVFWWQWSRWLSCVCVYLHSVLSVFWVLIGNSKYCCPDCFECTTTVPFPAVAPALALATCYFLIKYEIATLTYNGCHLKSTAISHSSARSLYSRSQDKHLLLEPAVSTIIGSWGFSHAAPSVWNKLPVENRNSQ